MIQITFHGRGGQGAVKAAQILALAASFDGKYAQAFPSFGIEREGAPVEAYCRIDEKPILLRSQIYNTDIAVIFDSSLLKFKKIKAKKIIVNSTSKIKNKNRIYSFDATNLALKVFGKPIVNTIMLAVFSYFTKLIKKESLIRACKETFSKELFEKNLMAIEEVYESLR
ncbi:MAG: 2-oxoacid:acceptor oxidoreductase family protein [Candidatus Pacearchaeota archaeon]